MGRKTRGKAFCLVERTSTSQPTAVGDFVKLSLPLEHNSHLLSIVVSKMVENVVSGEKFNNNVRCLIIDDEPSVGDALRLVLESKGYEVVLVRNGRDGIEQSHKSVFGFIIVDLFLTDGSGLEVIKNIHEHQSTVPILLITGHGNPEVFAEARSLGAIGGLVKPFQPAEILALIAAELAQ